VAVLILVAGVVAVVALTGKKKPAPKGPPPIELTGGSKVDKTPRDTGPAKPERSPPPPLSDRVKTRAAEVVKEIEPLRVKGDALYEEAMKARSGGDEAAWQAKLKEASVHFAEIRDKWNEEIIDAIQEEIPATSDWDAEEVANHYLGREGQQISKALEHLAYIKKQIRMD
jgi:hypothetical protein